MTFLRNFLNLKQKVEPLNYSDTDEYTITLACPFCKEYTDVNAPLDKPPTGNTLGIGWCVWCGKSFKYYY